MLRPLTLLLLTSALTMYPLLLPAAFTASAEDSPYCYAAANRPPVAAPVSP
jgi:hypothetical protein